MRRGMVVALGVLVAAVGFAQAPASVEGTVTGVILDHVTVKGTDGAVHVVVLAPTATVGRRLLVAWTDIKPGDWVGVDSKPGADGAQESVAINVFNPAQVSRIRQGQFPMASGDTMTNAQVDQVGTGGAGSLVLKNGEAMVPIRIGAATVVHRLVAASAADLKAGVKVTVRGTANADGSVQAANVTVE